MAKQKMLIGKYTVIGRLGSGGNAYVSLVADGDNEYALKILKNHHVKDQQRVARISNEIGLLEKYNGHKGIMPIIDSGEENGAPWYVMPRAVPISKLEFSYDDALHAVSDVAEVLVQLHGCRTFHRDIKPDNIFKLDGHIVVGDWGLVRRPEVEVNTPAGDKVGPAFFVAPEMLSKDEGEEGDKADVYALAKTLWCLLVRREYPMPGLHDVMTSLHNLNEHVANGKNAQINKVLALATQQDKGKRISISEFREELRAVLVPAVVGKEVALIPEDLFGKMSALVWMGNQVEDGKNHHDVEIEKLAIRVKDDLEPLLRQYQGRNGLAAVLTGADEIIENPGYDGVRCHRGWAVTLTPTSSVLAVRLCSGISVAAMVSGSTALIARHVLLIQHRGRAIWEDLIELSIRLCSAGTANFDFS